MPNFLSFPVLKKGSTPFSLFWDKFLGTQMGHIWMLDYWLDNTNNENQLIMKVNISCGPTWYDVNDRKCYSFCAVSSY